MKKRAGIGLMAVVAGLLAGCVSTPESRISRNPQVFAAFPPEVQAKVRAGRIDIGFTPDMVRLALGEPRQTHVRTTQAGDTEIWTYTGVAYTTTTEPIDTGYWYRDRSGRLRRAHSMNWMDVRHRIEYPALRVEFEAGKVKAIERLK